MRDESFSPKESQIDWVHRGCENWYCWKDGTSYGWSCSFFVERRGTSGSMTLSSPQELRKRRSQLPGIDRTRMESTTQWWLLYSFDISTGRKTRVDKWDTASIDGYLIFRRLSQPDNKPFSTQKDRKVLLKSHHLRHNRHIILQKKCGLFQWFH